MGADAPKRTGPCLELEMLEHDVGHQSITPACLPAFDALIGVALLRDVT